MPQCRILGSLMTTCVTVALVVSCGQPVERDSRVRVGPGTIARPDTVVVPVAQSAPCPTLTPARDGGTRYACSETGDMGTPGGDPPDRPDIFGQPNRNPVSVAAAQAQIPFRVTLPASLGAPTDVEVVGAEAQRAEMLVRYKTTAVGELIVDYAALPNPSATPAEDMIATNGSEREHLVTLAKGTRGLVGSDGVVMVLFYWIPRADGLSQQGYVSLAAHALPKTEALLVSYANEMLVA